MPPGEQLAPLSADVVYYNKEFLNKRDQKIYCYYWKPAEIPKAILLISHGFTEHCMMYDELAHEMARRRFFVFAHDHIPSCTEKYFIVWKQLKSSWTYWHMAIPVDDFLKSEDVNWMNWTRWIKSSDFKNAEYVWHILGRATAAHFILPNPLRHENCIAVGVGQTDTRNHMVSHIRMRTEDFNNLLKLGAYLVGHGHSEGTRAYMNCMHELVEDSVRHIKLVQEEYPNLPLFICGHSMGGSISLLTSLEKEIEVSGVVLIAPALAPNPETATFFKVMVVKLLNKFVPHFPVAVSDFGLSCQNEKKVEEMKNDPLRHHGYWKVRPVMCLLESGEEILNKSKDVKFPILVLHGDNDKICHLSGATTLYEKATSLDKTLKIYPGAYHSLLNEPEEIADDVFDQTVQWLDERA